jgi:hypothetical protein
VLQRADAPARVQITRTSGGASIKLNRWGLVDGTWLGFSLVPLDKTTTHYDPLRPTTAHAASASAPVVASA